MYFSKFPGIKFWKGIAAMYANCNNTLFHINILYDRRNDNQIYKYAYEWKIN